MRPAILSMTGCPPAPQWHLLNSGLSFPRAGAVSLAAGINPAVPWHRMDSQSKREIWLLAIGMVIVEAPIVAIAALAIAAAH